MDLLFFLPAGLNGGFKIGKYIDLAGKDKGNTKQVSLPMGPLLEKAQSMMTELRNNQLWGFHLQSQHSGMETGGATQFNPGQDSIMSLEKA